MTILLANMPKIQEKKCPKSDTLRGADLIVQGFLDKEFRKNIFNHTTALAIMRYSNIAAMLLHSYCAFNFKDPQVEQ